jgi:hypothetical protein
MRTYAGKAILVALILALGIGMAFWGCSKKSTTAPTPTGGRLFIWSLPDSAAVSIDGVIQTGMTPITFQNVSFAQHIIRCTKGNYAAVDTVVVHTGRSTPDTAFCWIPGVVNITSDPPDGYVNFHGWLGMTGGGSVGVWSAPSDTYQVTCSLSVAGRFKAVDTVRIWADSTVKHYVLPPLCSGTEVWYHPRGGTWQQGTSFGNVDSVATNIFLADSIGTNGVWVQIQLKFNGAPQFSDSFMIVYTRGFSITWYKSNGSNLDVGAYSQPTTWLVSPHNFLLAEPAWTVTSDFLGRSGNRGLIRAVLHRGIVR